MFDKIIVLKILKKTYNECIIEFFELMNIS